MDYTTVRTEHVQTDESLIAAALKTNTGVVSVVGTAPVTGQVLTATSSTAATWQTASGGGLTLGKANALFTGYAMP